MMSACLQESRESKIHTTVRVKSYYPVILQLVPVACDFAGQMRMCMHLSWCSWVLGYSTNSIVSLFLPFYRCKPALRNSCMAAETASNQCPWACHKVISILIGQLS